MLNKKALQASNQKLEKRRLRRKLNDAISKKKAIIISLIAFVFWLVSMFAVYLKWQENIIFSSGLAFGVLGVAAVILSPKQPIRTYLACFALLLLIIAAIFSAAEQNQSPLSWTFEKLLFVIFAVIYSSFAVKIFNIHLNDGYAIAVMCVAIGVATLMKWPLLPLFHHVLNEAQEEAVIDLLFLVSSVIAVELTLDE